jgi:pimeloyl-ACP methyl ester carboxylesterase
MVRPSPALLVVLLLCGGCASPEDVDSHPLAGDAVTRAAELSRAAAESKAAAEPAAPVDASRLHSMTVEVEGVGIRVESVGEGSTALVFVHGWMCDSRVWTHQVPALHELGRLVVLDLPGHGGSDKPERVESLAGQADDVAGALRALGVVRAVAVGHSNGSGVLLNLARRHPDLVAGLVIVEGAFVNVMSGQADEVLPRFEGEAGREAARATMVATLSPGRTKEELADFMAMLDGVPHHSALATLAGSMDDAGWSTEPIDVPVLALMAEAPWWTEEYWTSVQAWIPALETRIYPGATHMLMYDRPDDVNAEITAFVAGRGLLD